MTGVTNQVSSVTSLTRSLVFCSSFLLIFLFLLSLASHLQTRFENLTEAIEAVKRGDMWGVLHIKDRFSLNLQKRYPFAINSCHFLLPFLATRARSGRNCTHSLLNQHAGSIEFTEARLKLFFFPFPHERNYSRSPFTIHHSLSLPLSFSCTQY